MRRDLGQTTSDPMVLVLLLARMMGECKTWTCQSGIQKFWAASLFGEIFGDLKTSGPQVQPGSGGWV